MTRIPPPLQEIVIYLYEPTTADGQVFRRRITADCAQLEVIGRGQMVMLDGGAEVLNQPRLTQALNIL